MKCPNNYGSHLSDPTEYLDFDWLMNCNRQFVKLQVIPSVEEKKYWDYFALTKLLYRKKDF